MNEPSRSSAVERAKKLGRLLGSHPAIHYWVAAFLYLVGTVVLTWPVTSLLSSHLAGDNGDGWMFTWNLWSFRHSIVSLQNPLHTDLLFHPFGADLTLHSMSWLSCLISLPFQIFFEPLTTYNLLVLLYYIHAGFCMYVLCLELGASRLPAFVGGWLFTFSPFHFGHGLGHLNLMGIGWVPLCLFFLVRMTRTRRWKDAVYGGLSYAAAALTSWYFASMTIVAIGSLLLWKVIVDKRVRSLLFLRNLSVFVAVALLPLLPFIIGILIQFAQREIVGSHSATRHGAEVLSLLLPNRIMGLSRLFSDPLASICPNGSENTSYLGYVALGLLIFALIKTKGGHLKAFAFMGAVALILSLGSVLRFDGVIYRSVKLPFYYLNRWLPIFRIGSVSSRFSLIVLLSICAGAALALHHLLKGRRRTRIIACILGLAAMVEYLPILPHHATRTEIPEMMRRWGRSSEKFAVLDLSDMAHQNYHQIFHRKPILLGYTARIKRSTMKAVFGSPAVAVLARMRPFDDFPSFPEAAAQLVERNVEYIVLSRPRSHMRALMELYLSFPRVHKAHKDKLVIYRAKSRLELAEGFSPPYLLEKKLVWDSQGPVSVIRIPKAEEGRGCDLELNIVARAHPSPGKGHQRIRLVANGARLGFVELPSTSVHRRKLVVPRRHLREGENVLKLVYRYTVHPGEEGIEAMGMEPLESLGVTFERILPSYRCPAPKPKGADKTPGR